MGFELFEGMKKTLPAKISVRTNGQIGFSKGTMSMFKLSEREHCKLYFDGEKNRVGFEFTDEAQPNVTARLIRRGEDTFISGRPFLNYYNIDISKTRVYAAERDIETGFIVIRLSDPKYESTRGKRKK